MTTTPSPHVAGAVTTEQYADPVDPRPITLSDIDTTRALRTDDELLCLVAAIHGSRPEAQEANFRETYARVLDNDNSEAAEQAAAFLIGDSWTDRDDAPANLAPHDIT